ALKQNRRREDGSSTGLAVFRIRTENQHGQQVLDFWRCPMIPLRDGAAETGDADSFDAIPAEIDAGELDAAVPDWDLDAFRVAVPGAHLEAVEAGEVIEVAGRDTVSAAPELARLTLNVAKAHTDPAAAGHGRRLVYGGHTISVAAAQATRALPELVTV